MVRDWRPEIPTTEYRSLAVKLDDLYSSPGHLEEISDAVAGVLAEQMPDKDDDVVAAVADLAARESRGALFRLRNGIVSNSAADIQGGDTIRMQSARDPAVTVEYRVTRAEPDSVTCWVQQTARIEKGSAIPADEWQPSATEFGAGQVLLDDRFAVDRGQRDDPKENGDKAQ